MGHSQSLSKLNNPQDVHAEQYKVYTNIEQRDRGVHRITVSFTAIAREVNHSSLLSNILHTCFFYS